MGTTTAADFGDTGEVCELPQNEPAPGESVTITIRNETDVVQYVLPALLGCDSELLSLNVDGLGTRLTYSHMPPVACSGGDPCFIGCTDATYSGIALAPGAAHEVVWTGRAWVSAPIPKSCTAEDLCADPEFEEPNASCEVARSVAGRTFSVQAAVTSSCDPNAASLAPCGCDDPGGVCSISVYDAEAPAPEQTISAQGTFPEDVELVIAP